MRSIHPLSTPETLALAAWERGGRVADLEVLRAVYGPLRWRVGVDYSDSDPSGLGCCRGMAVAGLLLLGFAGVVWLVTH